MDYIQPYLLVSSMLFCLGIFAVITRKNAVAILMGLELILNSGNINCVRDDSLLFFLIEFELGEGIWVGQM